MMRDDVEQLARWANANGYQLRFTFHPVTKRSADACPYGTWDLTVKPGRDGRDHDHFLGIDIWNAIARVAESYGLTHQFSENVEVLRRATLW